MTPLARLRKLCLALPDAHEVEAWSEPTFRRKNRLFAMYASAENHHGGGRPAVWIKSRPENQELLIGMKPNRFFKPPYVGPSGWVGVWLDGRVAWKEIGELLEEGHALAVPPSKRRKRVRRSSRRW